MAWGRGTFLPAGLATVVVIAAAMPAHGIETKQQLISEIQKEQHPVRKAKKQIMLSRLEMGEVQDAYSHGQVEEGAKLLTSFTKTVDNAWKSLKDSGRIASRESGGFRELEISLRENVRALEDLERAVDYFDREPLEIAEKHLEEIHGRVIEALFPGNAAKTGKSMPPPPVNANAPAPAR